MRTFPEDPFLENEKKVSLDLNFIENYEKKQEK